jgi:uncharacterized membrane protein
MAKSVSKSTGSSSKTSNSNILGAVSYLFGFISGIILYLLAGNDRYVKFHAAQSTIWFLGLFVLNFALLISVVGAVLSVVVGIIGFVSWLFMMYKALNGEKYMLPIVGEWAQKYS